MLSSDEAGRRAQARLSFQIRQRTSAAAPVEISSRNVGEWSQVELPNSNTQLLLLLAGLADRLADDRFGETSISDSDLNSFAAKVGTIDGSRVSKVIDEADLLGWVRKSVHQGVMAIALTPIGWAQLELQKSASPDQAAFKENGRARPEWLSKLSDEVLRVVLGEIYQAIDAGLLCLPLMGARTAFDRSMHLLVGDVGSFADKLEAMKKNKFVNDRGVEILRPMIDAGSAAAHRGYLPTADVVSRVMAEVEHNLFDWFIRGNSALAVKAMTPPRSGSSP